MDFAYFQSFGNLHPPLRREPPGVFLPQHARDEGDGARGRVADGGVRGKDAGPEAPLRQDSDGPHRRGAGARERPGDRRARGDFLPFRDDELDLHLESSEPRLAAAAADRADAQDLFFRHPARRAGRRAVVRRRPAGNRQGYLFPLAEPPLAPVQSTSPNFVYRTALPAAYEKSAPPSARRLRLVMLAA